MLEKVEYDSPIAKITWDKRGIFILKLKDSRAIYDRNEVTKQFEFLHLHSGGKPFNFIVDTRGSLVFPTDCAFKYYAQHNSIHNKTAIVANSLPMQLMMGQMLIKLRAGNGKSFKTKSAAIEWILNS